MRRFGTFTLANPVYFIVLLLLLISCESADSLKEQGDDPVDEMENSALFEPRLSGSTGITFANNLVENQGFNALVYDAVYQGAGVAVGDINNDGLQDIFFSGNQVSDRLYLNKGKLKFDDITTSAGVLSENTWSTGVSFVDINADGYLDIYVCRFLYDDPQRLKNRLYINNGDLTFSERAEEYGLADQGYSIQANFFDYNGDGLLDVYIANQPPNSTQSKRELKGKKDVKYSDRLYKNNGNQTFSDVTKEAGVENYSFSLSATVSDLNLDGWPDIYVGCDYEEPDYYYQNNGDGTFTNIIDRSMRHISNFSMGADIADINNDGWPDLYVADMVADDNVRLKTNMSGMNPEKFWGLANIGYHYQYMFNALQLNHGTGNFSEIAQLAGVSNTDWSWSPLFADFDLDGDQDLIVTNGLFRDIRNNDARLKVTTIIQQEQQKAMTQGGAPAINPMDLIAEMPSVPIDNFSFRNNGDLTFTNMNEQWGFNFEGFSHGAAYADLDQDGDLDIVLNNMNAEASVFENQTSNTNSNNYVRLLLKGSEGNPQAIGAQITLFSDLGLQHRQNFPVRGFMSGSETYQHFGVGKLKQIDKIVVRWPDGTATIHSDVPTNQVVEINKTTATLIDNQKEKKTPPLFEELKKSEAVTFSHQENAFDDYAREILLPHRMSTLGPGLASADVNGDGLTDVYMTGASSTSGQLLFQTIDGTFKPGRIPAFEQDAIYEDVDAVFFDADGDGDQDLYVVSGGNETEEGNLLLIDRFYMNDGQGKFTRATKALPAVSVSGGCVVPGDIDGDGDLDLFIGGRQIPGKYGASVPSYILQNDGGTFKDVTTELCDSWHDLGMVTDAVWLDLEGDGDFDLVVVGEWMPIRFFENKSGKFVDVTNAMGTAETSGWWNTIQKADLDQDGDEDLVVGNLGWNIKYKASEEEPFKLFAKDFDGNGSHDVYLGYYDRDGICYPVRGRECSSQQLPYIKSDFPTYDAFAHAPIEDVLGDRLEGAIMREAKTFSSVWLENRAGHFIVHELPSFAQISPIFSIDVRDWNSDGFVDILCAGNYYEREVETTRSDAGVGCLLLGDGAGHFTPMMPNESGLNLYRDVRDFVVIDQPNQNRHLVIVANNNADAEFIVSPKLTN